MSENSASSESSSFEDDANYLEFNRLCASTFPPRNKTKEAKMESDMSWEPVREWLRSHSIEEVRQAAVQRGDSNMTALHFACRNGSLFDVIDVILSVAGETIQWQDSFGWLPIHYSCACGAEERVIKKLADEFPESKTAVDRRGRTPLHFAIGNQTDTDQLATPTVVAILSSTGAAMNADENGMLPLHYACAFGASEESLYVLTDAYKEAVWTMDIKQRMPLHFALSNAGRKASPGAVRHLLSIDPGLVNSIDNGPLPLRVLAEYSCTIRKSGTEEKESVEKCLKHLLDAHPTPTADFFTALQGLPDWLSEKAVVMPSVQTLLNDKISQRFPTLVLMCDFFCLVMIIVAYSINVIDSIEKRFDGAQDDDSIETRHLIPLYLGVAYFFVHELSKIMSLVSLNAFHIWLYDPNSWLNLAFMTLVLFWTIRMQTGSGDDNRFRTGTCLTVLVLYSKVLAYLRNMLIDFAVFLGGVLYVVKRLTAFLVCLVIILVMFAQMFVTVYQQTSTCTAEPAGTTWCNEIEENPKYYCDRWSSFLNVYTMLLGEVDEANFKNSTVATILFIFFMFLVVIILATVLIAIVTDSYKVIQDQRAAIVFWSNRLDFVAEMDAISNGPWKQRVKRVVGLANEDVPQPHHVGNAFGKEFWKRLMDLFDDEVEENLLSLEFWAYALIRLTTAFVIIPAWLVVGFFTMGWLWPPQVREAMFTSTISKHSSDSEKEEDLRKTQVALLQKEVHELREEFSQELAVGRTQVVQMKSHVDSRRTEIANEMKHIKRIVTLLFEEQATTA